MTSILWFRKENKKEERICLLLSGDIFGVGCSFGSAVGIFCSYTLYEEESAVPPNSRPAVNSVRHGLRHT